MKIMFTVYSLLFTDDYIGGRTSGLPAINCTLGFAACYCKDARTVNRKL